MREKISTKRILVLGVFVLFGSFWFSIQVSAENSYGGRIGIQLSDHSCTSQFGDIKYTPWTFYGGGWSGWASDSNNKDPDCARLKLEPEYFSPGKDFRLCIQVANYNSYYAGGFECTPWASEGGGEANWWSYKGFHPDLARLKIETRDLPDNKYIKDYRVGIQGSEAGGTGFKECWYSSHQGSVQYTPWASEGGGWSEWASDHDRKNPDCWKVYLEAQVGTTPPVSPKHVTIFGRVTDNNGNPIKGVNLDLCGAGSATTDSNGYWEKRDVSSGSVFCVRISSGIPSGSTVKAINNTSCHSDASTYEYQIAGENKFIGCGYNDERSWDRASDSGYDFVVIIPIAERENCSWNQVDYGHGISNGLGCTGYWINNYDKDMNYICPGNKVIAGVCSHHNSGKEDRKFNFYCCQINNATRINGSWNQVDYGHGISNGLGCTGYWINGYDDEFTYICPGNKVIAGVCSHHNSGKEDRKFNFYCVDLENAEKTNCSWTGWVNDYDKDMNYICPGNKVIAGVHSKHNNHKEDRKFDFYCCNITPSVQEIWISGRVKNNNGSPMSGVTIQIERWHGGHQEFRYVNTDSSGKWRQKVYKGNRFAVRISSGIPSGSTVKAINNTSCHSDASTYEYQIAGENKFIGCGYNDERSWDRASDSGYDFVVIVPITDTTPPSVSISGDCPVGGGKFKFEASASDPSGIEKIELWVNGEKKKVCDFRFQTRYSPKKNEATNIRFNDYYFFSYLKDKLRRFSEVILKRII